MKEISSKIVKYELVKDGKEDTNKDSEERVIVTDVKLPSDAPARMKTLRAEGKKWYITVVYLPDSEKPYAVFCNTNHREKTAQTSDAVDRMIKLARDKGILEEHIQQLEEKIAHDTNVNKLTRSVSLLLRHGVSIINIVSVLDGMDDIFVGSFLFQIKKFLQQYIKDGEKVSGGECEECGSENVIYTEGCMTCVDCGSGKCG